MHRMLRPAGVPEHVLGMQPGATHTCASCRAFAKPTPAIVGSAELAGRFNQLVNADFRLCAFSYNIFRVVGRCAVCHAA